VSSPAGWITPVISLVARFFTPRRWIQAAHRLVAERVRIQCLFFNTLQVRIQRLFFITLRVRILPIFFITLRWIPFEHLFFVVTRRHWSSLTCRRHHWIYSTCCQCH
jgi:hypothetical protein